MKYTNKKNVTSPIKKSKSYTPKISLLDHSAFNDNVSLDELQKALKKIAKIISTRPSDAPLLEMFLLIEKEIKSREEQSVLLDRIQQLALAS